MQQGTDSGLTPPRGHLVDVVVKVAKDDVTVTVNQRRGWGHSWAETRFRPILPFETESAGGLEHLAHGRAEAGLLVGAVVAVQYTHFHSLVDLAEGGTH